jgi:hypothetical protein
VPSRRTLLLEFLMVFVAGAFLLTVILVSIDNTNLVTTNGLWKSLDVSKWYEGITHPVDESNLLYFPVTGYALRLFPEALFGPVWRRMAFLNAIWAGMALGCLFLLLRGLGMSRFVAAMGALFQAGCAFFLALSITSEDIMAGLAFVIATIAMAVFVVRRPTERGVAAVALTFTVAWLFEWRLIFPTAPALVLGLLALPIPWPDRRRFALVALSAGLVLPLIAAVIGTLVGRYGYVLDGLARIGWTGKGLGTGWGGFRLAKLAYLEGGLGYSLFEGVNVQGLAWYGSVGVQLRLALYLTVLIFLFVVFVREVRQHSANVSWRTAGILLIGTFLFGEFFNFYSQPQDPQMQVNVMLWVPVAWAVLCARLFNGKGVRTAVLVALSAVPLAANLAFLAPRAGEDSRQIARVTRLEELLDLDRTVFVEHGFEGLNSWRAVLWKGGLAPPPDLVAAPQQVPRFKAMYLSSQATLFPERSPGEAAEDVYDYIDRALALGFQVVMNETWDWSEDDLVSSFGTISGPEKPRAISRALKSRYSADLLVDEPLLGRYYILQHADQN